MTLESLYESLGGNVQVVLGRLMKEERIIRFLKKFLQDPTFKDMQQGWNENNHEQAFLQAHTLKGVASNLGLEDLYQASSRLTEKLRMQPLEMGREEYELTCLAYQKAVENIEEFLKDQA